MSLFFETILVENAVPQQLFWHQKRVNRSLNQQRALNLSRLCSALQLPTIISRLRIDYDADGHVHQVQVLPYQPKPIQQLIPVHVAHDFDYALKFSDRSHFAEAAAHLPEGATPLFVKNGLLTDTLYANIALFDGQEWWTPKQPLLRGTTRARLIHHGVLKQADIALAKTTVQSKFAAQKTAADFNEIRLINALRKWEDPQWNFQTHQVFCDF